MSEERENFIKEQIALQKMMPKFVTKKYFIQKPRKIESQINVKLIRLMECYYFLAFNLFL